MIGVILYDSFMVFHINSHPLERFQLLGSVIKICTSPHHQNKFWTSFPWRCSGRLAPRWQSLDMASGKMVVGTPPQAGGPLGWCTPCSCCCAIILVRGNDACLFKIPGSYFYFQQTHEQKSEPAWCGEKEVNQCQVKPSGRPGAERMPSHWPPPSRPTSLGTCCVLNTL